MAMPEAFRVAAQPQKIRIGDRKMPPPVPVRPDRRPMVGAGQGGERRMRRLGSRFVATSSGSSRRIAATIRSTPTRGR